MQIFKCSQDIPLEILLNSRKHKKKTGIFTVQCNDGITVDATQTLKIPYTRCNQNNNNFNRYFDVALSHNPNPNKYIIYSLMVQHEYVILLPL